MIHVARVTMLILNQQTIEKRIHSQLGKETPRKIKEPCLARLLANPTKLRSHLLFARNQTRPEGIRIGEVDGSIASPNCMHALSLRSKTLLINVGEPRGDMLRLPCTRLSVHARRCRGILFRFDSPGERLSLLRASGFICAVQGMQRPCFLRTSCSA